MKKILLTNDDGVRKPGLWALYDVLKNFGTVFVVAPESEKSAVGMSITLHKPLRIRKYRIHGRVAYACSGTPSDSVIVAVRKIMPEPPDIVVSGINEGNNVSLQAVYGSGTVAAAIRASLMGYPSVAFSLSFSEKGTFRPGWLKTAMKTAAYKAKPIVEYLLNHGLPKGVDYLNVNFPYEISDKTPYRLTVAAKSRYAELVEERVDPREKPYYWLKGKLLERLEPGTDAYAIFVEKAVSVTPMKTDTSATSSDAYEDLRQFLERL
ncbi:MAG: 5'/3'-nucleotidase SurE [Candidatus Caldarchaeum sp.]|nr:5'/3'-nucleotidase SurE [Candidatus Caldarchaeum sp.]MCX8201416.1 5'/3'-nucleotidase SurE [Candidatus Caldarchaeum sp.]MDW8435100.1 5'/3'-nucleotidase SurE [Candidatus Caldarchaeum sp.]